MHSDKHLIYRSGDLSIFPQVGEVRNDHGEAVHLGPLNMRVLSLLISQPKTVITRNELFDKIWKNQEVSDDALTRCISDIRAQLKNLSPDQQFIDTLPRRGYRWLLEVMQARADEVNNSGPVDPAFEPLSVNQFSVRRWLNRGLLYLAALLLIASASVWLLDRFTQPEGAIIVVLPSQSTQLLDNSARYLDEQLNQALLNIKGVSVLAKSAIATGPDNPFPYFYFEFGARWIIESELRDMSDKIVFTVTLVDARTGIILNQFSESVEHSGSKLAPDSGADRVLQTLSDYLEAVVAE
jgi:DNA-binding winged helix-turn-helix (wHTH) protein/TolB-like protein